ncbi:hypothetical protein, partial [Lactococcus garvieae]|uniref:hypothetical protein n=1 Tax=Lactococcus garvieae TaxID=1363 RepID=UPI0022E44680
GDVDTNLPGQYIVSYQYGDVEKSVTITVKEKVEWESQKEEKKSGEGILTREKKEDDVLPVTGDSASTKLVGTGITLLMISIIWCLQLIIKHGNDF